MTRGASNRRRVRLRRRRRDVGGDADAIAEFGCCAIEAVGGAVVIAAVTLVPAYLLLS